MSEQPTQSGVSPGADVQPWWQMWSKNAKWRDSLARQAAHKALDIPDDEMHIHAPKTVVNKGIGALGAVAIAAAAGLPPTGLAAWLMMDRAKRPAAEAKIDPAEYEIDLKVEGGKIIPSGPARRVEQSE